jgi:hypothetical protein
MKGIRRTVRLAKLDFRNVHNFSGFHRQPFIPVQPNVSCSYKMLIKSFLKLDA